MDRKLELIIKPVVLFAAIFLLLISLFFIHSYYTFNVDPDRCEMAQEENSSLNAEYGYQEEMCESIIQAGDAFFTQNENLEPWLKSLLFALIAGGIYAYYEKLEMKYREKGVKPGQRY